jgi:hypothetical protein
MNKKQYNYSLLQSFCKENNIELIGNYDKINRDKIILNVQNVKIIQQKNLDN